MSHEEDTEEVVLTRWGKIKQWVEIAMATKKVAMLVWSLVFGIGGTMAVGKITETNPLRDAAIEMGLIEESLSIEPVSNVDNHLFGAIFDELLLLQEDVAVLEARAAVPGPAGKDGRNGKDGINGKDGGTIVLSTTQIDDALKRHIYGEH